MSNEDLVAQYASNPHASHSVFAEQIRARVGGKACIVFVEGAVDVEITAAVIKAIQEGDMFDRHFRRKGKRHLLYAVGMIPGQTRDEHPLHPGVSLNGDGTDRDGICWTELDLESRQLIRIAIEIGELRLGGNHEAILNVRDIAKNGGIDALTERYPQAAEQFEERSELSNLPALKVRAGTGRNAAIPSGNREDADRDDRDDDDGNF